MAKVKNIDDVLPGEILGEDIRDGHNRILISKGLELGIYHMKKIKEMGYKKILIESTEEIVVSAEEISVEKKKIAERFEANDIGKFHDSNFVNSLVKKKIYLKKEQEENDN